MMKKIFLYTIIAIGSLSCSKEKIALYDDAASKNSIYFPRKESAGDMLVSFGYEKTAVTDTTVKVLVRIIGSPVNTDRAYKLVIADSSTLRPDQYELINKSLVIPAGKVADTLKFHLKRTADMKLQSYKLYLRLLPNENFTDNFYQGLPDVVTGTNGPEYTALRLEVDDIAGAPPFWATTNSFYSFTFGYLGAFSTLKFQLLLNYYNLDVTELVDPNWAFNNGNYFRIIAWGQGISSYLREMAKQGNTIYEADGVTPMEMGEYSN